MATNDLLPETDDVLHEASSVEGVERRVMELAMQRTGARHGAVMLWDSEAKGLAIHFHVVKGLVVNLPDEVVPIRSGDGYNGVAAYAYDTNSAYLCHDAPSDPHYAPYYFEVASIACVPIPFQDRAIGVLSVSSRQKGMFDEHTLAALQEIAASSTKFLRRAQLFRASQKGTGRPFLIKGLSPQWLEVEQRIEKVSPTNAPVLVHGESGTGKELVANAIHFNSRRSDQRMVTVNCAAIPGTLLESVLFGHVKGAFTGATSDKKGEFQKADGGTLFLDELGELPVPLQAKVLRAVEDGEVQPLGSNDPPKTVDVRLVCATNRDLPAMVEEGTFRADLYFRLSVMTMELPSLRTYKDDNLGVMARVFVKQAAAKHEREVRRLSPEALARLHAHDFPGNVRELKNAMEHAVIMATGDTIEPEDLPGFITGMKQSKKTKRKKKKRATLAELREQWLAPLETKYLKELLDEHDGRVHRAAKAAGITAPTLYKLLEKRGMSRSRK